VSRILSSMTIALHRQRALFVCMRWYIELISTAGAIGDVPVALDFDLDFEYEDV